MSSLLHKQIGFVYAVACTCLLCGCQAILRGAEDAADKTELVNGELGSFWALLLFQETADGESPRVATWSENDKNKKKRAESRKKQQQKKGLTQECWHLCLLIRRSCWNWKWMVLKRIFIFFFFFQPQVNSDVFSNRRGSRKCKQMRMLGRRVRGGFGSSASH